MGCPKTTSYYLDMSHSHLRRWQAVTVSTLFVGYAGYYICRSNLSIATPEILDEYGFSKASFGHVASTGILFYAAGKFFGGITCDFVGGRRMFLLGIFGSVCASVLFGLGNGLLFFIAVWCGNRAVQSVGWGALVKVSSNWFSFQHHGAVMGILCMSYLLGDAVARGILGFLAYAGVGWRALFFYPAAVLGAIGLASLFLLKSSPRDIGEPEPPASPNTVFGIKGDVSRPEGLWELLGPFVSSLSFWLICILSFGLTLVRETFQNWTPTYLDEVAGFDMAQAAFGSILFPLCGAISALAAGYLSDRLAKGNRSSIMFVFLGLLVLSLGGLALAKGSGANVAWLLTLISLTGFFLIGPYTFLTGAISLDLGGKRGSATAAGLADSAGYLGAYISGAGMGHVADLYGWSAAFQLLAAVAALSVLCAGLYWWLGPTKAAKRF